PGPLTGTADPAMNRRPGLATCLRAGLGLAFLLRTRSVLALVGGAEPDPGEVIAGRVLGARHLLDAGCLLAAPDALGPVVRSVDAVHGASMLGLAAVSRSHRRVALASAVVAAVLAAPQPRATRGTG
ncbi:MAG: hypothetical protein M3529_13770, partial [Actinomycetota bacterium]|nr:hypothetical protein [Actinomycetota bacterium]